MKSNAAGQLLGYTIQFPRALYHLLHITKDGSVGIEVLGDVASFLSNGEIISEEDKSSVNSNPLTNRSTDLWKTFYNWITAINDNDLNLEKSFFILYSNQQGQMALVNEFDKAKSSTDADQAIKSTIKTLQDITEEHEIWKYYNYVINENLDIFKKLILHFELRIGKDASYEEVRTAIKEKIIDDDFVDYLLEDLSGWLQIYISEKIASKIPALISFTEFSNKFKALFYNIRAKSLINWALKQPPNEESISKVLNTRPIYVQQLDIISIPDDQITEAVSDYLKADINRSRWIETGVIDDDAAIDFENRLLSFWNNSKRKIGITHPDLDDNSKGELLLLDCKSRQESINNVIPPDRTIPGSYHALSDRKEIGWHPHWEDIIKNEKD